MHDCACTQYIDQLLGAGCARRMFLPMDSMHRGRVAGKKHLSARTGAFAESSSRIAVHAQM
jgi:hypothetical protein